MARTIPKSNYDATVTRLVRSRTTQRFYSGRGWTENPQEATKFADVLEAAETCARHKLVNVELAVRLSANGSDLFCTLIR